MEGGGGGRAAHPRLRLCGTIERSALWSVWRKPPAGSGLAPGRGGDRGEIGREIGREIGQGDRAGRSGRGAAEEIRGRSGGRSREIAPWK